MAEGARMKLLDKKIARHDELLADLLNSQQDVRNTQTRIQGTLKLILERLNTIERRSIRVPYLNCDETGICVCSIDCECAICIGSDTTCPESIGYCARSIDCECDICIRGDTSTGSEGLNYDETEINRPFDFHVLDDSQVQLDSLVLRCPRGLDLSSLCFSTWLNCVEIKATRVASYLFDKMSKRDHLQVVHVFIEIKSEFSRVLLKKGLVVPIWDPGISLKVLKLVGHTNNDGEILRDMTSMFCWHRSSDNTNQVWDTGWQWFMQFPVVHLNSICSVITISTYSPVYSGRGGLSVHVTTSSMREIRLLWSSILQSTLHDNYEKVTTIELSTHNWSVDGCTIRKASQRRGLVMARSLFTARAKDFLEELCVCQLCQPWLIDFFLLVALNAGAFNFCIRHEDGKATWLQITQRELLRKGSAETKVKVGISSRDSNWKDEIAMSLITYRIEGVGLYMLLSNADGSASLRAEAATVRTMVYGLYFTFDPGGILIGLENKAVGLQLTLSWEDRAKHVVPMASATYGLWFLKMPRGRIMLFSSPSSRFDSQP